MPSNVTPHVTAKDHRIAIVGVSALFPGSLDKTGFWRDIYSGNDLISDVPPSHWLIEDYYDPDPTAPDKTYAKRGAFLRDVDFDALSWGIPPSIIPATDTAQLLALVVAHQVLEEASGGQFETMDRSRISVILGVTSAQELLANAVSRLQRPMWVKGMRECGVPEDEVNAICERISANYVPWQESTFPGLLGNVVAGRIANRLDLGGTNCVTDAACASTFSAISMAVSELLLGDSDLVITGGVDTLNDIFMFMCFSKTPALSPTGDCRPFSAKGDGTMLGEGLGMIALKRLADAERDGDHIYGVLAGVGTSSDGRSKSVYAPVSEGQAKALRRAYEKAGYSAATVELVEAHGTGTVAGDAAEFGGLRLAFEGASDRQNWCALGSVKSQIGHTKAAAGAAGFFKALMSLNQRVIPPTIKVAEPNPKMDVDNSPFYLSTQRRPWVRGSDHPRRASVSSFGFGGSNFHLTLEEYRGPNKAGRLNQLETELFLLGGATAAEVAAAARALAGQKPGTLDAVTFLSRRSLEAFSPKSPARLAFLASSLDELARRALAAAERIDASPREAFVLPDGTAFGLGASPGKVAFLFPGQGSQYVGMGSELAMSFDACLAAWDRAADLTFEPGLPLHEVVYPRPGFAPNKAELDKLRLTQTQWAQPAIGCASLSQLGLLRTLGLAPDMTAGHSFGELTALCAAGAIDEDTFLLVARARGDLMAAAAQTPGAMLALDRSAAEARKLIERFGSKLVVANHNHPTQVVLSGTTDDVEAFVRRAAAEGVEGKRLTVATAFHSPVVAASCAPFAEALGKFDFRAPSVPAYSGVHARPHAGTPAQLRADLAAQIASPIDFVATVEAMYAAGARVFVEVGPGAVLTGLTAKILGDRDHLAVSLERKGKSGTEALLLSLARLAAAGVEFNAANLFDRYQAPRNPANHKPAKMPVSINGSNYGKPYPPKGGAAALPKPNPPRALAASPAAAAPAAAQPAPAQTPPAVRAAAPNVAVASQTPPAPRPVVTNHKPNTPSPASETSVASAEWQATQAPSADWLATFRETQRRTAEVQAMYQAAMAQSQAAYLQMAESSLRGLAGLLGGQAGAPVFAPAPWPVQTQLPPAAAWAPAPAAFVPAPPAAPPVAAFAPVAAPVVAAPVVAPAPPPARPAPVAAHAAAPARAAAPAPAPAPVAPAPAARAASPTVDVYSVIRSVVAESTGYPPDMLSPEMSLEGDLGIDSIKRVEILSLAQERIPGLPAVDAARMGTLETLGQIVDYMSSLLGGVAAAPSASPAAKPAPVAAAPAAAAPAAAAPAAPAAAAVAAGKGVDVGAIMLSVVAETTGYPADMLGREMSLEGDLGIDSIKRVEILSLVQDRVPGMPPVDAARMGSLETVGQIVDYIEGLLNPGAAATAARSEEKRPFV